ncbi:hypothetical protein Pcac1_g22474 [Phytophthora cactorum]|uniref:Uncharacterized protein n=1 Tax=Phytophthora cactorum TaxID=29920 RepID=A0A8T0YJJ9_9STRA|nr:hypothetical protein Pcac1_g22474 [Phytophthora cactorum]KAG2837221.1 hypothetical protein PC113_g19884 [Phytophthora cactorum]KAG2889296.1 hypothetical protein PC117_g24719 [Phytophthora cactorum]KAG2967322.1 hypothetical protein PC119_g24509 [Phytophthora cactorum]KAG3053010.1 hypothetical protein PC122_g22470 [Phytophthora cactorum]
MAKETEDSGAAGTTAPDPRRSTGYRETLRRWRLYDCSGFENPLDDDEMREWFEHFRATRNSGPEFQRLIEARIIAHERLDV